MSDVGIMWYEEKATKPLKEILAEGVACCKTKHGFTPRVVHVSLRQFPDDKIVNGLDIFPLNCILPKCFWFVRPNEPDMPELQTRTPANVTCAVDVGSPAPSSEGASLEPLQEVQDATGTEGPGLVAEKVGNRQPNSLYRLRKGEIELVLPTTRGRPSHKRRGRR